MVILGDAGSDITFDSVFTGQKCRGGACAMQRLMTADGYMSWISSVRFRMTDKTGNNIDGA